MAIAFFDPSMFVIAAIIWGSLELRNDTGPAALFIS